MSVLTSQSHGACMSASEFMVPQIANPHGDYPHVVAVDDLIFFSGVGPRRSDSVSFPSDFEGQCRQVFDNVSAIAQFMAKTRDDAEDVEFLMVEAFLTNENTLDLFRNLYQSGFSDRHIDPVVKIVNALPGSISVELKIMARYVINDAAQKTLPLSIERDRDVSGFSTSLELETISAVDELDHVELADDFPVQCDQVFELFESRLNSKGLTLAHVVDVEIYVKDLHKNWRTYNSCYEGRFHTPRPARTTLGVSGFGIEKAQIQVVGKALRS